VYGDDLIVRVGTGDTDAALAEPGVHPFGITRPAEARRRRR
jgi:hypothetical protein